jgi:hypothetical protein
MSKYADILKQSNIIPNTDTKDDRKYISSNVTKTQCISNKNSNYDAWEFSYFRELINMRDIFLRQIQYSNEYQDKKEYFLSPYFFNKFCYFIYETSSGNISSYLESLTEQDEDEYWSYLKTKKQE